jgi:hypothetical protein
MKKKNIIQLDPSAVHVRLGMCAAALVGTAAAVPDADATIITFNTPIPVPATFAGVYVNLGTGASAPAPFAGWDFNPYQNASTNLAFFWATTPAGDYGGVAATTTGPFLSLSPGTVVGPASTFSISLTGTTGSPYLTTGTHILGFRFFNETTGAVDYGYLTMSNTAPGGFPATILSWSYDDTGAPITVVPEPATAALLSIGALVLGALGLREWRRQRAA